MAKGQKRSNKEAKKPKQAKAKPAATGGTAGIRTAGAPEKGKGGKA